MMAGTDLTGWHKDTKKPALCAAQETLFGAPFGAPYGCLSVASGLEGRFTSS